jgi:hypothetical protein
MTRDAADVRDFALSADGTTLRYCVGATREEVLAAEQAEYDQGILVNEHTPIGQPLFRSGILEGRLATQRFSSWFNRVPLLADVPDQCQAVTLSTGARRALHDGDLEPGRVKRADRKDDLSEFWKTAVDATGERFALLKRVGERNGHAEGPDVELSMIHGARSRPIVCSDVLCVGKSITDVQWRPDSDEVILTVTDPDEGLAQSLYRWNVETGRVVPVVRSDGLLNGGRDPAQPCGVSASALICVAAEANGPPRLEHIDLETGQRHVLFEPNAALAQLAADTVHVRLLKWTDPQGRRFTGQFYPARSSGRDERPPLFVTYYSCAGYLRGGFGDEWPLASFAQQGIAAVCINHPPGYPQDAIVRYDEGLAAVRSVIDQLADDQEIDRTRVGMGGLSFGSEVAMWVAMKSNLLRAVSVTSPLMSPTHYLIGSLKGDAYFTGLRRNWQLGSVDETEAQWRVLSPVFQLNRIRAPVLMQMPEQEYMLALDYAVPLIRAGRAEVYAFPNEPHQKFLPRHKLAAYTRNLEWFQFWLLDDEGTDREKSDQYARWRAMRTAISSVNGGDVRIAH